MLNLGTLYLASLTPIYSKNGHLVDLQLAQASWSSPRRAGAPPGDLMLHPEESLAHPGELVPSTLSISEAQAS